MADIQITFVAEDGAQADVQVDETMTADQVAQNLVTEQFIPPPPPNNYWGLSVKAGNAILRTQSLQQAGVRPGAVINIQKTQLGGGHDE